MAKHIERGALMLLIGLSAGMLSGCDNGATGDWRVCADGRGTRVPDAQCGSGGAYARGGGGSHGGWVYIRNADSAPAVGETIGQGVAKPVAGVSYGSAPEGGIARGGFGGTGEGGGGGGGEGGHGGGGAGE